MDVLSPIYPPIEPHIPRNSEGFVNHMPAYSVQAMLSPEIWGSYYKFCVERNPWDKVISQYCMLNHRSGGRLSFQQFMTGPELPLNYLKYMDKSASRIIVDRVLRYENLMEELGETFRMLGIPFDGSLHINAKSEYRSDRRPYTEVFSKDQIHYITEIFSKEIALHGYQQQNLENSARNN